MEGLPLVTNAPSNLKEKERRHLHFYIRRPMTLKYMKPESEDNTAELLEEMKVENQQ